MFGVWCGSGVAQGVGSGLFQTLHAAPPSAPFGSSSLGNIGSSATTTSLHTGRETIDNVNRIHDRRTNSKT